MTSCEGSGERRLAYCVKLWLQQLRTVVNESKRKQAERRGRMNGCEVLTTPAARAARPPKHRHLASSDPLLLPAAVADPLLCLLHRCGSPAAAYAAG